MESSPLQSSKKRNTKARKKRKADICTATPFEILCASREQINPAILLAEELMRKGIEEVLDTGDLERAEEVLIFSREEINKVETQFTALVKTPAEPGKSVPIGF